MVEGPGGKRSVRWSRCLPNRAGSTILPAELLVRHLTTPRHMDVRARLCLAESVFGDTQEGRLVHHLGVLVLRDKVERRERLI